MEKELQAIIEEKKDMLSKAQIILTGFKSLEIKSDGRNTFAYVDGVLHGKGYTEMAYIHKVGEIEPTIIFNSN